MISNRVKPTTPGTRHKTPINRSILSSARPIKSLRSINKKFSGRNNSGKITVRHQGGRHKRFLRSIDFKRQTRDIPGKVVRFEYDPNRSSYIALIHYPNGLKSYILAPLGLKIGDTIVASTSTDETQVGNCLPLSNIPIGTPIHNIELTPGKGGQIVRSGGASAHIQDKEGAFVSVKLPSGEIRRLKAQAMATVGQLTNAEHKNVKLGKAGRKRHMGIRPTVRGVAQNPRSHPHGGGEGRSGIGMKAPKTPWGKKALGKKTRKLKKYSNHLIIKDRRKK